MLSSYKQKFLFYYPTTLILANGLGLYLTGLLWLNILLIPIGLVAIHDLVQKKHTLLRIYPVAGHIRYLFESIRPEIQQYFVESNIDGRPISREFRDLVYQRAKGDNDTRPFGTQFEVYEPGYEWLNHSLAPKPVVDHDPRVIFGGNDCQQPYEASVLNISAMSFGALSKNAILALNKGAKIGGFAHNTGEGGLSPYHLEHGGDLIWQIGTGYFGCRDERGQFSETLFAEKATRPEVKMIEIKLSQGAKPGHGGILPAIKLTEEIAAIRHVPMGKDVVSPPAHTAFDSPVGLLEFVAHLRKLSGGKPVGFKLCIGQRSEFLGICKAMIETGILPDFITVDGGEGGTGAAPVELTNSVGTPLRDALVFVHNALVGCNLRHRIRVIASGKALSAFHVLRLLALGADTVNVARAMMLALGCIQSRHCNTDKCPTGVATQDPARYKALDVDDKANRVAKYHRAMVEHLMELLAAAGLQSLHEVYPGLIHHRCRGGEIKTLDEVYEFLEAGSLIVERNVSDQWLNKWHRASAERF